MPRRIAKVSSVHPRDKRIKSAKKQEVRITSDSYTHLIYGVITVGIIFVIFLSALKLFTPKRKTGTLTDQAAKTSVQQENNNSIKLNPTTLQEKIISPTVIVAKTPTHILTQTPSPKVVQPIVSPSPIITPNKPQKSGEQKMYTVQSDDSLWNISEKMYNSGYNWVSIAQANHIANPGKIYKGDTLIIPQVTPIVVAQGNTTPTQTPMITHPSNSSPSQSPLQPSHTIIGTTYVIVHGDNLWNIAVRAYGDGYKWVNIARANNLTNPGLIFSGNSITIPR